MRQSVYVIACLAASVVAAPAYAGNDGSWWSRNWSVTAGVSGYMAPKFEGSSSWAFQVAPIVSISAGPPAKFSSRNDSMSFGLFDNGTIRAGLAGKYLPSRDSSGDLAGVHSVAWGVEIGGFAEVFVENMLRVRGEVRQGINAHSGVVADLSVDAYTDLTPDLRVSAGPRASFASQPYFDTYYGISASEQTASGLSAYHPGDGLGSLGVGGAITWKPTPPLTIEGFAEYRRLMGPAADSSIVRERGSANQFTVGLSTSYTFGL